MMLPPLPPAIVRHVIYPVYRGMRSDRVLDILDRLEISAWRSPGEIADESWRSLTALIAYAAAHVPYYRDLFAREGIDPARIESGRDLRAVPLLDRETVRRERRRLVTLDPLRRGIAVRTGGTTGEPLDLWIDEADGPLRRANILRGYRWAGVDIGEPVLALREAAPSPGGARSAAERLKNRLNNVLVLSPGPDALAGVEAAARAISSWGPALVAGPVGLLEELARSPRARGGGRRPAAVVSYGEPPGRERREAIEDGLGAPLFDRYQMREFSAIAMECPEHRGLHIFADLFHVEVLREDGSPAPAGEPGEVVVTGLTGRYLPLIRYRTGDLAVLSDEACPCGRGLPLLDRIEGRRSAPEHRRPAPAMAAVPARAAAERLVVKSKIHKARISAEAPEDIDCLRIDGRLLELGDVEPCERILIVNATSGARLETIALAAPRESGTISAGGAVSRLCRPGDEISVMAFAWSDGSLGTFSNILVDDRNRFVRFLTEKAGDML